ncbi:acyltransferase family protein [Paraburkholderia terricola]|uniref:Peptidoglycan/LPS O-acetylase OafA/YrhL, contains acyltransferase and SGNH-hydrolase domains n=1 Tax=Paraburkholderia terricola TaxID=169427 RepID=A0A1M6SMF7_9BURK|nr:MULTISPECIES: acyltransferase [Paraburkholderia]SDO65325.1 Peptidoglycan/LPS O-acetylase OafA/YrhL, contains acyltransferase and SGNH-hydrolase domains [Paraburkholderia sediminicola]SHK45817.1 Peptidoglycan/LPS O-acetylase OafA/YrhL, contains acyltransferase and SGNH-hydrolase domains [Paraburkholderia terricola]
MEKGRVAALDVGRALAIVGVVAVHLSFQFPNLPHSVTLLARMGQYGVQLFFVISAITIFMTLEADHERCAGARHVTLRFYIKRFFRIAPMYYAAIAVYGLISYGATQSGYERAWVLGAHGATDILLNVLFLHALSPTAINNVVPGGWSIGVEMLFYLIAPLLFFVAMNRLRLLIATVLLLALSLFALSIGDCRGTFVCHVSNNSFSYFWPPVQGPCFIIGMWAWYAFRSHLTGASSVTRRTAWLFFSLASVFALATAALGVWLAKAHELAPIFAACSAVAFLLFVCSRRHDARGGEPRGALIRRCADALGRESYGIYLWHFVCVYATLHFFEGVFGQSDRKTSLVLFITTVLAVLAASYAFSRVSDRMIQGRATRLSRSILAHVDRRFHGSGRA